MPSIAIEPELYHRVEQAASEQRTRVEDLLGEAVRRYLWELDRQEISEESVVYQQRHAELKEKYLGQYVAMRNGEIVDHDQNFDALYQRVRERFGQAPVMIARVEENQQPLVRHGFRTETPTQ